MSFENGFSLLDPPSFAINSALGTRPSPLLSQRVQCAGAERIYTLGKASKRYGSYVDPTTGAIDVCRSVKGMAPAGHHGLTDLLGETCLQAMPADARYRRDIY